MTFNTDTKQFEVAGPASMFRVRLITKKAAEGANAELSAAAAKAQQKAIEQASEILGQKLGKAGVDAIIDGFSKVTDLNADDIKLIKNKIIPILVIILTG